MPLPDTVAVTQSDTAPDSRAKSRRPRPPRGLIGRYRLLERIGEGGMGTVWSAQQTEPVRRLVALKLIKRGVVSPQALARFEAERQALALMSHPWIARIFDGGTHGGRPYLVMELVRGEAIDEYCSSRGLSLEKRLRLFERVCRAVHHAHEKGVVHRDLKPSNILVTEETSEVIPKVIDFGIAKALDQPLTDRTLQTHVSQRIGTPRYMSPEQAAGGVDVDARSDVYSLGVLLYELVTGVSPYSDAQDENAEFLQAIREHRPVVPSARLLERPVGPAPERQAPSLLPSPLYARGELDQITMHALEKDREHRYQTALALAEDVERVLSGEPLRHLPTRPESFTRWLANVALRQQLSERIQTTLVTVSGLVVAVCITSAVLLCLDAGYGLRLFGTYGPGGLELAGTLWMQVAAASVSAVVIWGARQSARGSVRGAVLSAVGAGALATWAVTIFSGLFRYTGGGLLGDDRVRRIFTLLYSVVFVLEFAVAVGGVLVTFLAGRYGRRPTTR